MRDPDLGSSLQAPGIREATEDTWIEDVFAVPHIAQQTVEFRFETGRTAGAVQRQVRVAVEVLDQEEHPVARAGPAAAGNSPTVVAFRIPGARLWSPSHPYLYTANVRLFDGDRRLDERRFRFGMREFKVEDGKFLLNGRPVFLRGYGDDCIYPNTIAPPVDAEEYRLRFRVIKDFGFHYVRHHSWTPPTEYLDAADEMGMLVQPEFPIDGPADLAATSEARQLCLKLWEKVIRQNRNHPSVAVWCMGNEIWNGFEQAPEMYRLAKLLDPTRPVIDSDGLHRPRSDSGGSGSASGQHRDTLDFLTWQFGESASFGYKDSKYSFRPTDRPVVAHELKTISFQFPRLSRPGRLRLVVQLTDSQGTTENDWDVRGFPSDRLHLGKFSVHGSEWPARQFPASVVPSAPAELPGTELLVTDRWEPHLSDYLEAGGRVLLLDPEPVFPAVATRYRPSGWDPRDRSSHVGTTFDAGHPGMESMPSEGWCDLQFHDLIQGGKLIRLDETPVLGEPLVRAIDIPQRLARNAYLFEARVGSGRLLVSGFNFAEAVPAGDPAAIHFLDSLIEYALGEKFQPRGRVPPEYMRNRTVVGRGAKAVAASVFQQSVVFKPILAWVRQGSFTPCRVDPSELGHHLKRSGGLPYLNEVGGGGCDRLPVDRH